MERRRDGGRDGEREGWIDLNGSELDAAVEVSDVVLALVLEERGGMMMPDRPIWELGREGGGGREARRA